MRALEVEKLCISFGGLKACQNVSLHIDEKEVVGLIGPNGAGKTTLFNLMTGIYKPTDGYVSICGTRTDGMKPFQITNECRAARTFQNIRLFKDLSVLDNVLVSSHLKVDFGLWDILFNTKKKQASEARIKEEAIAILKVFGLDIKKDEIAKNLPYGEQRKLEIVRALCTKPKLLFLDEPAAGMNDEETTQLLRLVKFIRDEYQIGILVIEHDMKFIMGLCDRIYVLDHGQLIAQGSPEEIRNNPEVIKAYLGEDAA